MDLQIDIKNITISDTTVNFSDLSFISSTGKIVCLTGRNGAGKSLMLKAICGIIPHKNNISRIEGRILYDGELLNAALFEQLRSSFALVAEEPAANILFSKVHEEIIMDSLVRGIDQEEAKNRTAKAMQLMGIEGLSNRSVNELSSGELQKVILANALTRDVSIIFLDEPTQNLDRQSKAKFFETLKIIKDNVIIVCATQDSDLVQFSDLNIRLGVVGVDSLDEKRECQKQLSRTFSLIKKIDPVTLELCNLGVGIKKRHRFSLGPISFRVKGGQAVWVKGANGSGKTTLLETLAGIRNPLSGMVKVNGTPIKKQNSVKRTFAQHPPTRTFLFTDVKRELSSLSGGGQSRIAAWKFAKDNWISFAGDNSQRKDPRSLSYGQQKVLNLLCRDTCAEILIFDEPTSSLDEDASDILIKYLLDLKNKGRLVIFASHDELFANQVSDLIFDVVDLSLTCSNS